MRALIWKEIKELAPGFWLLVGMSWALGVVDVAYNWNRDRSVGMSLAFCWLVSAVAALLAGANSFAREDRGLLVFLNSWPLARWRIWLAKVLVPAVTWVLLVGLAVGGCAGLLAMRGYDPFGMIGTATQDLWVIAALWVLLFGAGVMASAASPSPMAAALGGAFLLGPVAWGYMALYEFIPSGLGPWLGLTLPEMDEISHLPSAVVFSVVCLAVSAVVIRRGPLQHWLQRLRVTVQTLVAMVAGLLLVGLCVTWVVLRPEPPTADAGAYVEGSGHWIIITSRDESLWAMDVEGERLRLLSRGPAAAHFHLPRSPRIAFYWGTRGSGPNWVADLGTGRMWRLPTGASQVLSPLGNYWLDYGYETLTIRPIGPGLHESVELSAVDELMAIGWSPDESTLYVSTRSDSGLPEGVENPRHILAMRPFEDPDERVEVGRTAPELSRGSISPDGRWLRLYQYAHVVDGMVRPGESALFSLDTGETVALGDFMPFEDGWTANGRYLWGRPFDRNVEFEDLRVEVYDLERREVIRRINSEDTGGLVPLSGGASPYSPHVRVFARAEQRSEDGHRARGWWLADTDGSNLRKMDLSDFAHIYGWTHDGDIVVEEVGRIFRYDPDNRARRTIYEFPASDDG